MESLFLKSSVPKKKVGNSSAPVIYKKDRLNTEIGDKSSQV